MSSKLLKLLILFTAILQVELCIAQANKSKANPVKTISIHEIDKKNFGDLGIGLVHKNTGEVLMEPQKNWSINGDITESKSGDLIRVQSLKRYAAFGYVDMFGNMIIPMDYEIITNFYKGSAIAKQLAPNKMYGVINNKGQIVVPFQYSYINAYNSSDIDEPLIVAKSSSNNYGVINILNGQVVVPFAYKNITSPGKTGIGYTEDSIGTRSIINYHGKTIYKIDPSIKVYKSRSYNNKVIIEDQTKKSLVYLDSSGKELPKEGEDFETLKNILSQNKQLKDVFLFGSNKYFYFIESGLYPFLTDKEMNVIFSSKSAARIKLIPTNLNDDAFELVYKEFTFKDKYGLIIKNKLIFNPQFTALKYYSENGFPNLIFAQTDPLWQVYKTDGSLFINDKFYHSEIINDEDKKILAAFKDTIPELYNGEGVKINNTELARRVQLSLLSKIKDEKWYKVFENDLQTTFRFDVELKEEKIKKSDQKNYTVIWNGKEIVTEKGFTAYRSSDSIFAFITENGYRFFHLGKNTFIAEGHLASIGSGKFGLTNGIPATQPNKYAIYNRKCIRLTEFEYLGFMSKGDIIFGKKESGMALLDKNYKPVTDFNYSDFFDEHNGVFAAEVITPKGIQYLTTDGKPLAFLSNGYKKHVYSMGDYKTVLILSENADTTMLFNYKTGQIKKTKKDKSQNQNTASSQLTTCGVCDGSGKVLKWVGEACEKCNGSGGDPYKCFDCNGKGKIAETKVLSAQYYGSVNKAQVITQTAPKECRSCRGKGYKGLCYMCDGKGVKNARQEEVNCSRCKGTGEVYSISR